VSAPARKATRRDVARLAGTSTAVVSYVINNGPRNVSPERRARVLAAMAELDYQPNAIARSLSSTETRTLGMIVPNINNGYFAELALAVEEAALARGRLLFLGNSNEAPEREAAYITSFLRQRVDGVIIIGVARASSVRAVLDAALPVVVLDRALEGSEACTVSIDHHGAAFAATTHLVEHGHRSIACLTGLLDQSVAEQRLQGWADALRHAGIDPSTQMTQRAPFSLEGGMRGYEALAADGADRFPAALFVATDEQARGVIAAAGRSGRNVPHDLAIVSVDGTREGEFSNPPLTSIRQPFSSLADAAIEAVLGEREGEGNIVMESALCVRRSCGCPGLPASPMSPSASGSPARSSPLIPASTEALPEPPFARPRSHPAAPSRRVNTRNRPQNSKASGGPTTDDVVHE
jgi:LacI family transcriptional regulator